MKPTQMFQSLQHMMRLISWLKTEKDSPKKRQTIMFLILQKRNSGESSQKRQTSKNKKEGDRALTLYKSIDKMPCLPVSRPLYTENISSKWKNLP